MNADLQDAVVLAEDLKRTPDSNICVMSECRQYRYTWWPGSFCDMTPGRYAQFIGLNPSTADEATMDPTVRRCIQFAKDWGYSGLCMTNLFAYRATDPKVMKQCQSPVGPDNDFWLKQVASNAGIVIAAWGTHGKHHARDYRVRNLLREIKQLHMLRKSKDGHPSHPLYLPGNLTPQVWQ